MFQDWRRRRQYNNAAEAYQADQLAQQLAGLTQQQQQPGYGVLLPEKQAPMGFNYQQEQQPGYGVLQQQYLTDPNATQAAAGQSFDWMSALAAMGSMANAGGGQPMMPSSSPPQISPPPQGDGGIKYFRQSEPLRRRKRRGLLED